MQFHSLPLSEPVAIVLGVLAGVAGHATAKTMAMTPADALTMGNIAAVMTTLFVGGAINLAVIDVLALVLVRPLTAMGTPYLMDRIIGP